MTTITGAREEIERKGGASTCPNVFVPMRSSLYHSLWKEEEEEEEEEEEKEEKDEAKEKKELEEKENKKEEEKEEEEE